MFVPATDIDTICKQANEFNRGDGWTLGVFVGAGDAPDLADLVESLNGIDAPFFGGVFPGLIHGAECHESGVILAAFPSRTAPLRIDDPGRGRGSIPEAVADQLCQCTDQSTLFVLVDAVSGSAGSFLKDLHHVVGSRAKYMGAGAGFGPGAPGPCLFDNEGVHEDAAIVVCSQGIASIGVRHGWRPLTQAMIASRTSGNVINEINWQDAYSVYSTLVEEDAGLNIDESGFSRLAMAYPLGLIREGREPVVRGPLRTDGSGSLECAAEVPPNAGITILRGDPDALIAAAGQVAHESLGAALAAPAEIAPAAIRPLVVNCLSRSMFLRDRFTEELGAVSESASSLGIPNDVCGVLALGEVSGDGLGTVELLSGTVVVGALHG